MRSVFVVEFGHALARRDSANMRSVGLLRLAGSMPGTSRGRFTIRYVIAFVEVGAVRRRIQRLRRMPDGQGERDGPASGNARHHSGEKALFGFGSGCADGSFLVMPKKKRAVYWSTPNSPAIRLSFWFSYSPRIRIVYLSF
jgi:hypothetical protein